MQLDLRNEGLVAYSGYKMENFLIKMAGLMTWNLEVHHSTI